jgi:hypothetical protein
MYHHSLEGDRSMPASAKHPRSLKCQSALIPTTRDDRAALRKIGVVAISLCFSFATSVSSVILELEGIGRGFWIALQVMSLASFLAAIALLVREMTPREQKGRFVHMRR